MSFDGLLYAHRGTSSTGTDCPICGSADGRCRQGKPIAVKTKDGDRDADTVLCMTETASTMMSGWRFSKEIVGMGTWGFWVEDVGGRQEYSPEEKKAWAIAKRLKEQEFRDECAQSLSADERHQLYSRLLGELTLSNEDLSDLTARGMSESEVEASLFRSVSQPHLLRYDYPRSLPGIDPNNPRRLYCASGYLCPVIDPHQRIVGAQIRILGAEDNKYRWLSSPQASPRQQNAEFPLCVRRPAGRHISTDVIGLVEGVGAKPFLASTRLNQVIIGAAGGQFSSSPETLREAIAELGARGVVLYPDKGAIANPNILVAYTKVFELLQEWDLDVRVGWWGQEDSSFPDVDELSGQEIKLLTVGAFQRTASAKAIANFFSLSQRCNESFDLARAATPEILKFNQRLRADLKVVQLKSKVKCLMHEKQKTWADVSDVMGDRTPSELKGSDYQIILENLASN